MWRRHQRLQTIIQEDRNENLLGLTKEEVDKLDRDVFSFQMSLSSMSAPQCTICLLEFKHKDTLFVLPRCRHQFHEDCLGKWIKSNITCPNCRRDIRKMLAYSSLKISG